MKNYFLDKNRFMNTRVLYGVLKLSAKEDVPWQEDETSIVSSSIALYFIQDRECLEAKDLLQADILVTASQSEIN